MSNNRVGQLQAHPRFPLIAMGVVLFAMFMANLTVTAVTVAVPEIAADFNAAESTIVWAVTGPLLVGAILGPTFGKLGDQRGHRFVFSLGLAINALFTLLIGLSWGAGSFLAFRILASVGMASIGPTALAFINHLFSPAKRATALGWWSFVAAGAPVIGVVAGGYVIEAVGWRIIFLAQAPMLVAALALAVVILPETPTRKEVRFDIAGAASLAAGIGALLLGVTLAGGGAGFGLVAVALAVSVVCGVVFVIVEGRVAEPLIPPRYWRERGFVVPTLVLSLLFAAYMGSFVLAPLMLQSDAFLYTAAATSTVIISRPLMFSLTSPFTGLIAARVGERTVAFAGGMCVVGSMFMLSRYSPSMTLIPVAVALGLAGIGMGLAAPTMIATVANSVSEKDLGVAGAAQQMVQQVGIVIGIQALQALQSGLQGGELASVEAITDSYQMTFAVGAAVAVCGTAVTLFLKKKQPEVVEARASGGLSYSDRPVVSATTPASSGR